MNELLLEYLPILIFFFIAIIFIMRIHCAPHVVG